MVNNAMTQTQAAGPTLKPSSQRLTEFLAEIIKGGVYLTLFLPLLINQNFLFPFAFPRTVIFRIIVEICLALYLFLLLTNRRSRPQFSPLAWLFAGFIIVLIVTTLTGVNPYHSFWSSTERSEGLVTWLHLFFYFILLTALFKTREDWLVFFSLF